MFADLVPGTGSVSVSVGSLDRARCGEPSRCARPLSVPLLGADRRAARLPLLYLSDLAKETPVAPATGRRSAHPRRHRHAADAAGFHRRLRALWASAAVTTSGSIPTSPISSPARASASSRCPKRRSSLRSIGLRNVVGNDDGSEQERRQRSRLCALRAGAQRRGADRRSALSRRRQARRADNADRQGAGRRGACASPATARGPSGYSPPRSTALGPQPHA